MSQPFTLDACLPWAPLYTVERSGIAELHFQGLAYAWAEDRALQANAGRNLLKAGNPNTLLWSRSLLKPFQLLALYPRLKQSYPQLQDVHFALMLSSHSGEEKQRQGLQEILSRTGLDDSALQCPACGPMAPAPGESTPQSVLNHPCAGKHIAHLLYQRSLELPLADYLQTTQPAYAQLRLLLGFLLGRDDFTESVDGCGMPNLALSVVEIAQLYHALLAPLGQSLRRQAPSELQDCLAHWSEMASLMQAYPDWVGGTHRLDTELMQAAAREDLPLLAKEGADGLLAVAVGKTNRYPDGLGILIKLACGYQSNPLRHLIVIILEQLGVMAEFPALRDIQQPNSSDSPGLQTLVHFACRP